MNTLGEHGSYSNYNASCVSSNSSPTKPEHKITTALPPFQSPSVVFSPKSRGMEYASQALWIALSALAAALLASAMGLFNWKNHMPVDGKVSSTP